MKRAPQTLLLIALSTLALSACGGGSGSSTSPTQPTPSQPTSTTLTPTAVNWQSCSDNAQIQCATMKVPMDHNQPTGKSIQLALRRMPSSDASKKLGVLLFNPGGPGGPAVSDIAGFAQSLPQSVRAAYDLVVFDPRGVGQSTPLNCESEFKDSHPYPFTAELLTQVATVVKGNAERCYQRIGEYLRHVGSNAVVQDMEWIRQSLNVSSLSFIGYSYGTRLAALYAQRYPSHTGRFILDASMHPNLTLPNIARDDARANQKNLDLVAQYCANNIQGCQQAALINGLTQRLTALKSLTSDDAGEEVSGLLDVLSQIASNPEMGFLIAAPLWQYSQAPSLTTLQALTQAMQALQSDAGGKTPSGQWNTAAYHEDTLHRAVMCADHAERPTAADIEALRASFESISDIYAESFLGSTAIMCHGWPEALSPIPAISTQNAPKMLVIGGDFDAATPLSWATAMAQATQAKMLNSAHLGHTVLYNDSSRCVDNAGTQFLLTGQLPQQDNCAVD